jgi:hypothetical protein
MVRKLLWDLGAKKEMNMKRILIATILLSAGIAQAAQPAVFKNQFKTGTGNDVSIKVTRKALPNNGSEFGSLITIHFKVKDNGYFAGARSMKMPIDLHIETGHIEAPPTFTTRKMPPITLRRLGNGEFAGSVTTKLGLIAGAQEDVLRNATFSMEANGKVDSALEHNYKISVPDLTINAQ